MKGAFIVLEGIDGSGTTTQLARLSNSLRAMGRAVTVTREPSQGPVGQLIRRFLVEGKSDSNIVWGTMALLFAADRTDHLARTVRPALEAGSIVLSDRYDLSSLIYQTQTAPGGVEDAQSWVRSLNRDALRPDLTIVLDVPEAVARERRRRRGGAEEVYEVSELQQRLARDYAHAEEFVPDDRLVHLEGAAAPDTVAASVLSAVQASGILSLPAAGAT